MGAGVKEVRCGEELVGRKGRLGGARAGGGLSSPDTGCAGLGGGVKCQTVRFGEMFPASLQPRIRSLEKGALSFEVRGEEGAGLRWRGRGRFP